MSGEQPGEGGPPAPPLTLSSAHSSILAALLCHRDGAGLFLGAQFTDEDIKTLRTPAGFAQQPLLGDSRDEPQWVFPILLPPHPDCVLPSLQSSPLCQKKEKQSKAEGHPQALQAPSWRWVRVHAHQSSPAPHCPPWATF